MLFRSEDDAAGLGAQPEPERDERGHEEPDERPDDPVGAGLDQPEDPDRIEVEVLGLERRLEVVVVHVEEGRDHVGADGPGDRDPEQAQAERRTPL